MNDIEITPEMQRQLTSEHLKRGMSIEMWLIPYSIVTTLAVLLVTVMVTCRCIKKRSKKSKEMPTSLSNRNEYMTTESDDKLHSIKEYHDQPTHQPIPNGIVKNINKPKSNGRTSSTSSSHLRMKMATEITPPPEEIPAIPPPSYNQVHSGRRQEKKQPEWLQEFGESDMPSSVL